MSVNLSDIAINIASPVKDLKLVAKLIENNQRAVEILIKGLENRKVTGMVIEGGVD